ncbi:hypothetical protein TNCV_222101 [Trichonephila clavipes]|nr:hypothetical protein TNCV_222101 [Trichonephila clavipes]
MVPESTVDPYQGHMRFEPFDCANQDYEPVWQTCEIPTSNLVEASSLNRFRRGVMWQPYGCKSFFSEVLSENERKLHFLFSYLMVFGDGPRHLNHGQVTKMTSELAHSTSPTFHTTSMERRLSLDIFDVNRPFQHGGSSLVPGSNV